MELVVVDPAGVPTTSYAYTGGRPFDPTPPCVVFVHGALNDHSVWTLAARWFAHHGHGVLAVDLPGHGRSAGAPLDRVEALGGWLLALLDAAGVRQAALVGHSMGSLVALEAAAQAPARATWLAMVATAYPMKVSDALLATAAGAPLDAIDLVCGFSHTGLAPKPSWPGPGSWLRGGSRALMRRMQAGPGSANLFAHDFAVCDRYANGLEAAAAVRCPTTLILGRHDRMTAPSATRALASALTDAAVTVDTLDAGHSIMAEAPDALLAALRRALGVAA